MQRLLYALNIFMHTNCVARIRKRDVNEVLNYSLKLNIWTNLMIEIQFTLISSTFGHSAESANEQAIFSHSIIYCLIL